MTRKCEIVYFVKLTTPAAFRKQETKIIGITGEFDMATRIVKEQFRVKLRDNGYGITIEGKPFEEGDLITLRVETFARLTEVDAPVPPAPDDQGDLA